MPRRATVRLPTVKTAKPKGAPKAVRWKTQPKKTIRAQERTARKITSATVRTNLKAARTAAKAAKASATPTAKTGAGSRAPGQSRLKALLKGTPVRRSATRTTGKPRASMKPGAGVNRSRASSPRVGTSASAKAGKGKIDMSKFQNPGAFLGWLHRRG